MAALSASDIRKGVVINRVTGTKSCADVVAATFIVNSGPPLKYVNGEYCTATSSGDIMRLTFKKACTVYIVGVTTGSSSSTHYVEVNGAKQSGGVVGSSFLEAPTGRAVSIGTVLNISSSYASFRIIVFAVE